MTHRLPPAPRAATDVQLAQAVDEIKRYIAAAVAVAVVLLFLALVIVGPFAQRVLENVAPDIYCDTIECTVANS